MHKPNNFRTTPRLLRQYILWFRSLSLFHSNSLINVFNNCFREDVKAFSNRVSVILKTDRSNSAHWMDDSF